MIATSAATQIWQNKALRQSGHRPGRHGFSAGLQISDERRASSSRPQVA